MRAGKLDRTITIEHMGVTVDDYGTPGQAWAPFATVRAQILQASTEEFIRGHGASSEAVIAFRIRYLDGVTLAHRVKMNGKIYELKEIKEVGRRKGLDLRCVGQE